MAHCNTLVMKIASRCNINCTYCYMYNLGDTSWKKQPKFISKETIKNTITKVREHCKKHNLTKFTFILHGGEPLLMDKKDFVKMLDGFSTLKKDGIQVVFSIQSNGILMDEEWCKIFNKYKVGVGISIDGPKVINDTHRLDKKGRGTYDNVIKGLSVCEKHKDGFVGTLSVLNVELDAIETYNHIRSLPAVRLVDFLLLDMNYDTYQDEKYNIEKTESADWYIKIFDDWFSNNKDNLLKGDKDSSLKIRLAKVIIHRVLGGEYSIDTIGPGENNVLVLETNGGLEAVDVLKICGEGFTKDTININTHSLDDALKGMLANVYYNSGKYLPKKCLACPVNDICGGGYLPHRYSSENGFNNPSIYCNDLLKLITHIQNRVVENLPLEILKKSGIEKLTYEEAKKIIERDLPSIKEQSYFDKLEYFRVNKESNRVVS